ncbi:MAG: addiction module antidote protein, HigA family [Alphaproteobacteria bacterium 16-39-46]|nr:MAG: addiction module antidote protein, HigA family [Alphaproteobacteria bacterium 16-39-46]OZA43472.1 MAG: addiction module antidote protein, HigA family [Alphaproteobacteria bacterium 17-39-52]HQS84452.1 HigA family addiction module antitoxin [Alphaproteobacteria bacterium]HQS94235.1 HigA family addiction module antitoxin [Alphaproteobacteria bacterium]
MKKDLPPIHPGEILLEEFMNPLNLSANQLSKALGVPTNRITSIINGQRGITADTALRLQRYFGLEPQFWLSLQNSYDIEIAEEKIKDRISSIIFSQPNMMMLRNGA